MTVYQALQKTRTLLLPPAPLAVEESSAAELLNLLSPEAEVCAEAAATSPSGTFRLALLANAAFAVEEIAAGAPRNRHWAYLRVAPEGDGELVASHPALLYAYTMQLLERWRDLPAAPLANGRYHSAAFRWHRPLYDSLLTQVWRTARDFDPEEHIREMARAGYTHIEVNALAMPVTLEETVPGEYYAPFYTRCLALDQFVYSELNKGIYPVDYLTANLNLLKKYARIGRSYGLEPGILCWEPRSVPERLLQKYPTLRGARVDHPFRSRKPRYTLTIAHPLVQEHYRELMQKLLEAVPDLAYISIRTNDSGAGFEHTNSLYAGRNGGPYLIREWHSHEEIAEAAGKNVVRFMEILRTAAAPINPAFRVSFGLGSFETEREAILAHLTDHMDIEVGPDQVEEYHSKGITPQVNYTQGTTSYQPVLGIPSPWDVWEKLQAMGQCGTEYAANSGGHLPTRLAPYNINQEVARAFILEPGEKIDQILLRQACQWVGQEAAAFLIEVWKQLNETLAHLPRLPLYSEFGFVWYRLWVRPLVPDLHAVPEAKRRYYEDFIVSPANNTTLVDLGRDVLFELFTREYARDYVERVGAEVLPLLETTVVLADRQASNALLPESTRQVFIDQRDRIRALRCWIGTLRNVAAWVVGVYGYLAVDDAEQKQKERLYLDEMISKEVAFTKDLLELWEESPIHFMVVSQTGETSYIYGENFGELLQQKIQLMEDYRHVEPRIDPDIMWKV